MTPRRLAVRAWSEVARTVSIKRCSFWKLVTIILTVSCTWIILVIIDSSDLIHKIASRLESRSYEHTTEQNEHKRLNARRVTDVPSLPNNLIPDYIDKSDPNREFFKAAIQDEDFIEPFAIRESLLRTDNSMDMVLFFVEKDRHSPQALRIAQFLTEQRILFKTVSVKKSLPAMIHTDGRTPRFSLLIFEDYVSYLGMDSRSWNKLMSYCLDYLIGVLAFTRSSRATEMELFSDIGLKMQHRMKLHQMKLAPERPIWRVAKPQVIYQEPLPTSDWTVFITSHETFKPLAYSTIASDWVGSSNDISMAQFGCVVAIHDVGLRDGVHRIILGHDVDFWLNDIIAMDAMTFLSGGRLELSLERLLQVDVDDMFVGKVGIRTKVKDAEAMLSSQEKIAKQVPGFRYNLGFSGGMFMDGNDDEKEGDKRIVELASKFVWFDHMHRHLQPHRMNVSKILLSMQANRRFAKEYHIPVSDQYMVTPHHSGVYPVYEPLYDAWEQMESLTPSGNRIMCTSTEEYPRQIPHYDRRGFVYRGVLAVPRQTCMLYTHTIRFEDYHGGKAELDFSIKGGYLFKLFLHTQLMIFMTHMSNYATDRLAQYSFEGVITNIKKWTNLKIAYLPPCEMAWRYFELYPEETTPTWTNPCDYNKHMEIWPEGKSCNRLPQFIIVGPQKTGTTALYSFLEGHPSLVSSKRDTTHFEEVQFFNGKEYLNGLDWYLNRFPEPKDEQTVLFEKSANYFDSEVTPKRIFALLPKAKIVIIVSDPGRRAYSWYHHLRSHQDPTALNNTFFKVISAHGSGPKQLKYTRNRCLKPGMYALHLKRWLQYFPSSQIYIVDGDRLINDPVPVMNSIQKFLKVQPFIDYKTKLRYDHEKGFFCRSDTGCLSPSKGRKYPPMDAESARYLANFYKEDNSKLKTMLKEMGRSVPIWLNSPP